MIKLCIKCGLEGHTNRSCKGPVTSFGLIVYTLGKVCKGRIYPYLHTPCKEHPKISNEDDPFSPKEAVPGEILFLLVERKDTVGFLNIVQGSYPEVEPYKTKKIQRFLNELTCEERHRLLTWSFADLWKVAGSEKKDVKKAETKFRNLDADNLINGCTCQHKEADYLMPKGRLKFAETTKQCALREFAEETGYNRKDVTLLDYPPYIEQFTGTDGKLYQNVFYIARLHEDAYIHTKLGDDPNQSKEVRNMGWFNLNDCMEIMRGYHQEKKDILKKAHILIQNCTRFYRTPQNFSTTWKSRPVSHVSHSPPERWNSTWRPHTYGSMGNVASIQSSEI